MIITRTVCAVLFAFLWCAVVPSHAENLSPPQVKQRVDVPRTGLSKEPSMLNIPLEITTDDLARIVNQSVRKELYTGATMTRGLSAEVLRNGPIQISAADDFLYITLPVSMSLHTSMFETKPIPLKLKFRATATVTPDWRLRVDLFYLGASDLLAEEVGLGPLTFKPRSLIDSITQPLQKLVSELVTKKINEQLALKAQVAKVWKSAQSPLLLDSTYKTWLQLSPREVMLSPLYARNNRIQLSAGINTFADMVVGPEPVAAPLRPLPDLKLVNAFDKTFRIALNADVFFTDLRAIAEPFFRNRQFESEGRSIIVRDFDLSGNGEKLVVKLVTEGALDGVVYLTAKPAFNLKTRQFSVEDVDFDLQTQSLLLKSADWFLHGTIRSIIQEKLNMNLTGQLERTRQIAAQALTKKKLTDYLFLKCDIKELKFRDALVQQDRISIQVYTEGESVILFQ